MNQTTVRANITLSTGAIITHRREPNGSQFAWVANRASATMTESEWDEYCVAIRASFPVR